MKQIKAEKAYRYIVNTWVESTYIIDASNEEEAREIGKGWLLEKIESKDVAYDDIQTWVKEL